jgi:very-short-patch-repair endonuclease
MSPDEAIAAVAARQYGAFDGGQARDAGFSQDAIDGRVASGRWLRPYRGVYAIAGSSDTWERRALSALLAYGERAVASHTAAAYLLGMIEQPPDRLHISLPRGQHREDRSSIVPHTANLARSDRRIVRGIRTTGPERTLVDLAGIVGERGLEAALDDAIQLRLTTIPKIRRYVEDRGLAHNAGAGALRRLLEDRAENATQKALERMFRRKAAAAGLPKPKSQFPIAGVHADFAWPAAKIIVELDGLGGHFSAANARRDKRRDRAAFLAGYTTLRYTWDDIADKWPETEIELRTVLAWVGCPRWPRKPHRCKAKQLGDDQLLGREHLVRRVERHFRDDVDPELRHRRAQAVRPEGDEVVLARPRVEVVVVAALPPRHVRQTTVGDRIEPADLGPHLVVLLRRDAAKNDVRYNGHADLLPLHRGRQTSIA